jgi:hypothetical protein
VGTHYEIIKFLRYYSLDVSYFKSLLDKSLLEFLWNRYWVNTLSSSNLLTVNFVFFSLMNFNLYFSEKNKNNT